MNNKIFHFKNSQMYCTCYATPRNTRTHRQFSNNSMINGIYISIHRMIPRIRYVLASYSSIMCARCVCVCIYLLYATLVHVRMDYLKLIFIPKCQLEIIMVHTLLTMTLGHPSKHERSTWFTFNHLKCSLITYHRSLCVCGVGTWILTIHSSMTIFI